MYFPYLPYQNKPFDQSFLLLLVQFDLSLCWSSDDINKLVAFISPCHVIFYKKLLEILKLFRADFFCSCVYVSLGYFFWFIHQFQDPVFKTYTIWQGFNFFYSLSILLRLHLQALDLEPFCLASFFLTCVVFFCFFFLVLKFFLKFVLKSM